ncbi:MAG: peptide deformylase [Acidobacteriaceae bacterium]
MIRKIVTYPDPILQRPTDKVTAFDDDLRALAEDMFESMYKASGIGLAAPQIGLGKRITVIDLSNKANPDEKIVLVNPEIVHKEGRQVREEGCLSLPDIRDKVARAAKVKVKAQDLEGKSFEMEGDDLLAIAFQHEIDHLDGILFPWRVSALKRDLILRRIRKLQKAGEWK